MFWSSQTTDDDYLGVEINGFVENSIDNGAASAGWSCFANVAGKKFFSSTSRLVCTLPPSEFSIDIKVYFAQNVRMDTGVSMPTSMQFVSHV